MGHKKSKKTVGVITMHRVINYGSFLQAYATQRVIEALNCECDIIDYVFPNNWHYENGLKKRKGIKSFITNYIYPLGLTRGHRKIKKINNAIHKYLNLSKRYDRPESLIDNPPLYDVYITGSDQTWNTKHTKGDEVFLLTFGSKEAKKISFSASLASKSIKASDRGIFEKELPNYDSVAIRDENGNKVIRELIGQDAEVTLDPTLMLDKNDWKKFASNKKNIFQEKKFIVFYLITHSFDSTPYIYELLKKLQNKTGYQVYSFSVIPDSFNIKYKLCSDLSVEHFIQLYLEASYVVTSSFHGTAFAANFGVPMYSVVKDLSFSDDRQSSLLTKLGIENCLAPIGTDFDDLVPEYNVKQEQSRLNKLREESNLYLLNSL